MRIPFSEISIVLLHGFFQDSRAFETIKKDLVKLGFEVFTPDLLGFGLHKNTTKEAFETQYQVTWLVDYIRSLQKTNLFICGYSMGARLVLQAMKDLQNLVSGFIIESGTNGIESESEREVRKINDRRLANLARTNFKEFQNYWMNHPTLNPVQVICFDDILRLKIIQSEQNPESVALSLEQFGTAAMPFLDKTYFEPLQKPVLFIAGDKDTKFAKKAIELETYNSEFQSKLIENCGHRVHLEKPNVYVDEVVVFINRIISRISNSSIQK
jgi:2-succinyl-6-hydroxy-2,4-cyclohexadiene-1-carboxylate synthase